MKTHSYKLLTFFLTAFVIASIAALGDTIYNAAAGSYLTGGFLAVINFFAQNTVANFFVVIIAAVFFAVLLLLYSLTERGRKFPAEKRWFVVFWPAAAFLVFFLVAVPVNMSALPNFMTPISLAVNAVMFVTVFGLIVAGIALGSKFAGAVSGKKAVRAVLGFSVISAVSVISGFTLYNPEGGISKSDPIGGPNVIIITIDALRQDRVSAYKPGNVDTPNLDAFAARSLRFEEACTNNPWTIPSMFTMNSSRYPTVHGADTTHIGNENVVMLAEVLKSHGYETEGYVANQILYGELGFNRGFDRYVEYGDIVPLLAFKRTTVYRFFKRVRDTVVPNYTNFPVEDSTEWLTNRLVSSLSRDRDRPFFVWAHYLDPHTPLTPPRKYVKGSPEFVDEALRLGFLYSTYEEDLVPGDREWLVPLYEAEVRYVDESLKKVFDVIEVSGLYENSIIIITADHGEEFFEHGKYGHGKTHYDEVISIPMMIYLPGVKPGVSKRPVSLIDIMPTVLDYVGADAPAGMSGKSLLAIVEGSAEVYDEEFIFIDRLSVDPTYKSARIRPYTLTRSGPSEYAYVMRDMRIDIGPDDIVAEPDVSLFERYRGPLDEWAAVIDAEAKGLGGTAEIGIDAERREELKGLGYLK